MKMYHIVYGRPIGPSLRFFSSKERAESQLPVFDDSCPDLYGAWIEETTLDEALKLVESTIRWSAEGPRYGYRIEFDFFIPHKSEEKA